MTWPPPTVAPLPPPRPSRDATAKPIAAWLAATGGALVLVAAIVVVAGNWQDIAAALKFAGLVAVTVGLGVAAERARDVVPATARAVAHAAAALAAPVGIAAAAVAGGTWPVCLLTGGALAGVVCVVQARRWQAPLLDSACVIAIGLALVGLAALVPVPVGVLAVIAAGGLLLVRRDASAAAVATAAGASPILVALAEQRIGDGTLARIGATGEALAWSAPLVGVLAGGVLAIVASRRNAPAVGVLALSAPLVGAVTGLATHDVDAVVWLCLPAIVLAALELIVAVARTEPWRGVSRTGADAIAAASSAVAIVAPVIAAAEYAVLGHVPVVPLLFGASALAMTVVRTERGSDAIGGLALAGTGSFVIAVTAALGWPLVVTAAIAVAVVAGTVFVAGPRWLPVAPAMASAAGFLLVSEGPAAAEIAVGLTLLVLAVDLACRDRREQGTLDVPLALATFAGAALVASSVDGHWATGYVAALAVAVGVVAWRSPLRAPALLLPVSCAGAVAMVAVLADAGQVRIDSWFGIGILALASSAAMTWWRTQELWTAHLAAGLAIGSLPFGLTAIGASRAEVVVALLIVSVVLAGTSLVVVTSGPIATAAMTASALAAALTPAGATVLVSVAVVVFGIQVALEGLVRSFPELTRVGAGLAVIGAISAWWTSGADDAVIRWLAPHGVTNGDLAVAAIIVLLLAAGAFAGRLRPLNSWVTAGPGLGLLILWLLDAQLARPVGWSVPLALSTGIVAVGVGGWRRLAAPLILGTATIGATIVVSAGPRLADLDSWVWLAVGGLALIGLAVLIERTVSADRAPIDWRQLRSTWR